MSISKGYVNRLAFVFSFVVAVQFVLSHLPCQAQSARAWPEADRLFHSDLHWLGGDGAFSVDLGKGKVLWLFGDSFIAARPGAKRSACRMVRNSIAIEHGYDPSKATIHFYWRSDGGQPGSYFPERKEHWLWPMHGARLGKPLLLFYNVIGADSTKGSLGFKGLGATAFWVANPDEEPGKWTVRTVVVPANSWNITLGVSVLEREDYLYVFGVDEPKHDVYLSRLKVSMAKIGNLSQIEWWSARTSEWLPQSSLSPGPTPLFTEGSTELSVHWDVARRKYVEVQSTGFGASTITIREAKDITGPWSAPKSVCEPPESREREPFVYAGKAHPELRGADVIATYAANGSDKRLMEDMSLYFPRFVRIQLVEQ